MSACYLVAGCKPWSHRFFDEEIRKLPGTWQFVGRPKELTLDMVKDLAPRYIFFLHWSWKVPQEIVDEFECVCFHMTDVPYGRGGSPLQNLIVRNKKNTKLTALRMAADFDMGPVYLKEDLCLIGNAEEIYIRATRISSLMIKRIIEEQIQPKPQSGQAEIFERRKPEESEIPDLDSLESLHDFIRMLDADGYPRAFIEHKGFCFEFNRAAFYDRKIIADVVITSLKDKK